VNALKQLNYMNSQVRAAIDPMKKLAIKQSLQKVSGLRIEKAY
jgi:hypothetical protein